MDCEVSYDRFWAYIGIPYFFIILLFGGYVLFTLDTTQLLSSKKLLPAFDVLRQAREKAKAAAVAAAGTGRSRASSTASSLGF